MAESLAGSHTAMWMAGYWDRVSHTVMVPSSAPDTTTFGFGVPVSSVPTQVTVPCSSCKHGALHIAVALNG